MTAIDRYLVAVTHSPFERLKTACLADWQAYCHHDFVRQLGAGTLAPEAFRHYLKQDYLFLLHFARAWGLAVYKSRNIQELCQGLETLKAIVDVEMGLHVQYCTQWGIREEDLTDLAESRPTLAYTRYVLDTGLQGDLLDLHVALAPCLVGYAEIATWLCAQDSTIRQGNPYDDWIRMYESEEFQSAACAERAWLDTQLHGIPSARFAQLARTFREAARLEADFWQMGLELR